jgi:hypothetical protein
MFKVMAVRRRARTADPLLDDRSRWLKGCDCPEEFVGSIASLIDQQCHQMLHPAVTVEARSLACRSGSW